MNKNLRRFKLQYKSKRMWPNDFNLEFIEHLGLGCLSSSSFQGKRVCDFGAGTGRLTPFLLNLGLEVTNYEPNTAGQDARNRVKLEFLSNRLSIVDRLIDLKDNHYDLVICIGVIHHLKNPEPEINEILRILAKSGIAYIWIYKKPPVYIYIPLRIVRLVTSKIYYKINYILATLIANSMTFAIKNKFFGLSYFKYSIFNYKFNDLRYMLFDQLNADYSKYYVEIEVQKLMKNFKKYNPVIKNVGNGFLIELRKDNS